MNENNVSKAKEKLQQHFEEIEEIKTIDNKSELNDSKISIHSVNWMEKLKPSSRNKLIQKRYRNLSFYSNDKTASGDLMRYGIDLNMIAKITNEGTEVLESAYMPNSPYTPTPNTNNTRSLNDHLLSTPTSHHKNNNYLQKWNKCVVQSKLHNLKLDISDSNNRSILNSNHGAFDGDNSIAYFEEINDFIEEKCKNAYTENMFLKQQEHHSIIPFLLIHCKEVHRVCLSDYEIKLTYKSYKSKSKSFKAESFDFYRIGLINFYKGKYLMAYNSLRSAVNATKDKEKEPNIIKWYLFVSIVILFCEYNKLDFSHMKRVKLDEESSSHEDDGFTFFPCCSSRKSNDKFKNVQMQIVNSSGIGNNNNNNGNLNEYLTAPLNSDSYFINKSSYNVNQTNLAREILELIDIVTDKTNSKSNQIEGWWIKLLISTYASINKNQKLFAAKSLYDPKYCIKKIRELDDYFSYIAYAQYNYLISEDFQIDKLLKQLISKYPGKVEAYMNYWQLLVKGKYKNYALANSISEIYWKNSSTLHFDDGIYYLYILVTHAKSSYLIGNHFYSITYFQKEYPSNFLFPSLYYLFGKYSSKSKSKSLKNVTISSLKEAYRLLYEDLQYSVLYWLGNIYYMAGSFDQCFKHWKKYLESSEKSFDVSYKKLDRIKTFLKSYEVVWNSLNEFKKNLRFYKKIKYINNKETNSHNNQNNVYSSNSNFYSNKNNLTSNNNLTNTNTIYNANTNTNSNATNCLSANSIMSSKLSNFLKTLQSIKDSEGNLNLKFNKSLQYDYYKAICFFYIDKNYQESMKILMNIIHSKRHQMKALFAMWKILSYMKQYKLLLNLSYFIVKISHMNEVSFTDWIKSYIFYSRALLLNKKQDEAIILLINTLDVFALLPLEDAKYMNDIYRQNKISTTNFFVNFDKALQFYSKYQVYKKNQAIFQINYTLKKSKTNAKSEKFVLNVNDIDENGIINIQGGNSNNTATSHQCVHEKFNFESNVSEAKDNLNNTNLLVDIDIDSFSKLEEYIEKNIDNIEVPSESPFLTIISNPDILLEIGKTCAKSETKRELGLMCLEDYITILKFVNNYKLNEKTDKKKQKAFFWMSILHIQLKQYNLAKQCIDKIDKLYEFDTFKKKSKIVKMFIDFYKQFICLNDSVCFDFEISKEDLNEI